MKKTLETRLLWLICTTSVMKGRWWRRGGGLDFAGFLDNQDLDQAQWGETQKQVGVPDILSVCLQGVDGGWGWLLGRVQWFGLPTLWFLGLKVFFFRIFDVKNVSDTNTNVSAVVHFVLSALERRLCRSFSESVQKLLIKIRAFAQKSLYQRVEIYMHRGWCSLSVVSD